MRSPHTSNPPSLHLTLSAGGGLEAAQSLLTACVDLALRGPPASDASDKDTKVATQAMLKAVLCASLRDVQAAEVPRACVCEDAVWSVPCVHVPVCVRWQCQRCLLFLSPSLLLLHVHLSSSHTDSAQTSWRWPGRCKPGLWTPPCPYAP